MPGPSEIVGEVLGKARGAAKSVIEGYGGIFRELAQEHGEVSMLMKRVAASSESSDTRRELFGKIRLELLSHAKAEERVLYPELERHDETRDLAQRSYEQHARIEALMERLTEIETSSPEWTQTFESLIDAVESHVDEEENEVFVKAKDFIDKDQARELQERYQAARAEEKQRLA